MGNEPIEKRQGIVEPGLLEILRGALMAIGFVVTTRLPFVRTGPVESDEFGFLRQMSEGWFPTHHTLFQTLGRAIGMVAGGDYQGLVWLDMMVSALALVSVWWWLRALVRPSTALATAVMIGVAPLFWSLGEMAGNYTMIPVVGSFLLGVAYRGWKAPRPWHPYASAVVLAIGTGYREDIGTYLLPVFAVILWNHRWKPALGSVLLFTALNLAWLLPMLSQVGGIAEYRRVSAEFAYSAGFKNSAFHLGVVDAPVRYVVKMGLAFFCLLGPGLVFVRRGIYRLGTSGDGRKLLALMGLSVVPALGSHLLIHFGVAGYCFHYLAPMAALLALGVGRISVRSASPIWARAWPRLAGLAMVLALAFLCYPADIDQPGWRGDLDLAVGRYTRQGLHAELTRRASTTWRTKNSVELRPRDLDPSVQRAVSRVEE